jgi:hypothetical protein
MIYIYKKEEEEEEEAKEKFINSLCRNKKKKNSMFTCQWTSCSIYINSWSEIFIFRRNKKYG